MSRGVQKKKKGCDVVSNESIQLSINILTAHSKRGHIHVKSAGWIGVSVDV